MRRLLFAALWLLLCCGSAWAQSQCAGPNYTFKSPLTLSGSTVSSSNVFNVVSYGATAVDGNGPANLAAIQSAITAACAQTGTHGEEATVFFPSAPIPPSGNAVYAINGGILQIPCNNITIDSARNVVLHQYANAPTFLIESSATGLLLDPPLLGGGSGSCTASSQSAACNSLKLTDNTTWLQLMDLSTLDLWKTPPTAFTVEATLKPTNASQSQVIVSSQGKYTSSAALTSAFALKNNSGSAQCKMDIGGTVYTVSDSGTSFTNGTPVHVACSYDGSTLRLFVGGVSKGTPASASGTVTQQPWEGVSVGPDNLYFDSVGVNNAFTGDIDSLRISNNARYTSNFTPPTSKFTSDTNTLALLNFDNQAWGPGTVAYAASSATYYLLARNTGSTGSTNVTIKNLNIVSSGSGIVAMNFSTLFNLADLIISSSRYGVYLWDNNYEGNVSNVKISAGAGSFLAWFEDSTSGSGEREALNLLSAGPFGLWAEAGGEWKNLFYTPTGNNEYPAIFSNPSGSSAEVAVLINPQFDNENGAPTKTMVTIDDVPSLTMIGGGIESSGATDTEPLVAIDDSSQGRVNNFIGTSFQGDADTPEFIHVITAPSQPVTVISPYTIPNAGSVAISDDCTHLLVMSGPSWNSCGNSFK
jgi:hypothetical protein